MQARQYSLLVLDLLIYINNFLVFLIGFEFIDVHQLFDYQPDAVASKAPVAMKKMIFGILLEIPCQLCKQV
jgi:hypothetical protein